MDIKTLLIAVLVVLFATSLSMAIVWWTRRAYPGFGYWAAGASCWMLGFLLFIPREHFPAWLTIILANYLLLAGLMLNNRGVLVFRCRPASYGWEIAASLSFIACFFYFTAITPDVNARIIVISLYSSLFQLWTVVLLLTQRPAYFGSGDIVQAVTLGGLTVFSVIRAGYTWAFESPIADFMVASTFQGTAILFIILGTMLVTLSEIIMNTQRLEYDYRMIQERLDLALDGGNIGLYTAHLPSGTAFFDERFQRIVGYRPGEMAFTVRDWLERVHPEDQPMLLPRYEEVIKGRLTRYESEYRTRCQNGSWLWVIDRGKSFDPDQTGQPRRIAGALMDISARKQVEENLHIALHRIDTLISSLYAGVLLVSNDGRVEFANQAFCNLFDLTESPDRLHGLTAGEMLQKIHRVYASPAAALARIQEIVAQGQPVKGEELAMQGGRFYVRDFIPILIDGRSEGRLWHHVDITERKQAEAALSQAKMALEEAQRLAQVGSWEWEIATDTVTWSKELYRIFGWDLHRPPPTYREHPQIYTAESIAQLRAAVEQAIASGIPYELDLEVIRPDGSRRWIISRGEPRYDADHRVVGLRGTGADVTDRHRMEEALRESETKFRLAFNNANTGMCLVDLQGRILQVNARMCAIFGYSQAELESMTVNDLALPEDNAVSLQFIQGAVHGDADSATFEKRYRHRQGHVLYGQIASSLVRDGQDQPLYFISQVQDITDRKRLEAELREQAVHDPLTGLFNRRYLDETLRRELHRCKRNSEPLTVAMFDLDHFKRFNDAYGHEAGDIALQAIGELLRRSLRSSDIACRYGGEELTVILPGSTLADARERLESLREAVMQLHLFYRGGELPAVTVSIGVAGAVPGEMEVTTLLSRADAALYQAKKSGRNRVIVACSG